MSDQPVEPSGDAPAVAPPAAAAAASGPVTDGDGRPRGNPARRLMVAALAMVVGGAVAMALAGHPFADHHPDLFRDRGGIKATFLTTPPLTRVDRSINVDTALPMHPQAPSDRPTPVVWRGHLHIRHRPPVKLCVDFVGQVQVALDGVEVIEAEAGPDEQSACAWFFAGWEWFPLEVRYTPTAERARINLRVFEPLRSDTLPLAGWFGLDARPDPPTVSSRQLCCRR